MIVRLMIIKQPDRDDIDLFSSNLHWESRIRYPGPMSDPYEQDIDGFHEFLKTIHSIDAFYERKKPAFRDWFVREMISEVIEQGYVEEGSMLLALKQGEKQRYVRLRNGTAAPEEMWPLPRD